MSYLIRNGCHVCKHMQYCVTKTSYYQFYSKPVTFSRGVRTCNNLYSNKIKQTQDESIYQSCVKEPRLLESISHDVVDNEMFDYLKFAYIDKVKNETKTLKEKGKVKNETKTLKGKGKVKNEPKTLKEKGKKKKAISIVEIDEVSKEDVVVETTPRKRHKKATPTQARYEGNQLTVHGERNALAEIDIYLYLGDLSKVIQVFNFHRRYGHRFGINVYNKVIHAWAVQKNWKNIELLRHTMTMENVEPNYQTYAVLLEACGNIGAKASSDVESILKEIHSRNINIEDLFRESLLTKQQIKSIQNALLLVGQRCFDSNIEKYNAVGKTDMSKLILAQIERELQGLFVIKSIETTKSLPKSVLKRSNLYQKIIARWKKDFISEMNMLRKTKDSNALLYNRCVTYGCVLSPNEIANIVFERIVPLIASQRQGVPTNYLCRTLGDMMYTRFCSKFQERAGIVEKVKYIANEYCSSENIDGILPREKWDMIRKDMYHLPPEELRPSLWSFKTKTMASSVVLDTLKKVAFVDTTLFFKNKRGRIEQSIFHEYEKQKDSQKGIIRFHPAICRLYSNYLPCVGAMSFNVDSLPMIVPPKPWLTPIHGGYLLLQTDFIRYVSGNYKDCELSGPAEDGLNRVFDATNYVGNCAWRVNGKLLDIMIQVFNGTGDEKLSIIGSDMIGEAEANAMKKLNNPKERKAAKKEFHELHSLRMDLLYKLSVANHFRNDVLWIPNNLDFRGRIYPVAPHCCHIGNDVSRSMLVFAKGKKLGEKGLDWLKVHLVNVHGQLKKASLSDRIKYADLHMDDIMDSADNPLTGRKWWQNSSDPWQTLIACMETTDAIRSGDPTNFISHLPVQQDGSCNGLQHYAALGRDLYGAKQVNLMPADKPQDIYNEVAKLVEKAREKDASDGVQIAQQLEGKITRKVVKQTVMTVVYGVTFIGGRLQVEKQLKELNVEKDIIFHASVYIVKEVFKGITNMFTSARQIQDWLTVAASQISLSGNCVDWITPLNLSVLQHYHRKTIDSVLTPIQRMSVSTGFDYTQMPNLRKQKGGFPPNFIHSLDSSHMFLTALRCQQENLVFTSVHDSFWTHACDVDQLNRFCREEFIYMHKLPILEDLKKHFDEKFSGLPLCKPHHGRTCEFDELPERGEFDLDKVLDSVYFFS